MRFKDLYGQKWVSLFQGDESIETWRVTWASGLDVSAEQIKHALSLIGSEYPEWPPTFGQFKALCLSMPAPYIALPAPVREQPSPEALQRLRDAVKGIGKRKGQWWTPERVVNASQVNLIVIQANKFGPNSDAGRFLAECKAYGCISSDNRIQKVERVAA